MTKMASSGEERTFESGAVRDSAAKKPMIHLISPFFLEDLGEWLRFACQDRKPKPYPPRNWEKGMPFSETLGSGLRHLIAIMAGDESEDHYAALGFCAMVLSHYRHEIKAGRLPASLDDMPHYETPKPGCRRINPKTGKEEVCYKMGADPASPEGDESVVHVMDVFRPDPNVEYVDGIPSFLKENPHGPNGERTFKYIGKQTVEPPTFYICGPMRNIPQFNFPLFDKVAELARSQGLSVISPAELDREHGIDPTVDPNSVERAREADPNLLQTIVQRDTQVIVGLEKNKGNGLILLPGWEKSTGGRAEIALAIWMGLKFKRVVTVRHGQLLDAPEIQDVSSEWVVTKLFYQGESNV